MNRDLNRLYSLLESLQGQRMILAECIGRSPWPRRGVYFFREPGEFRSAYEVTPRLVRVGTHAVSAGASSSLWGRIRTHRGNATGGGNHRGSIFRRHVGDALRRRDGLAPESWGRGSSAPRTIRDGEVEHERRVSAYLGQMTIEWVDVPDDPGPQSQRAMIERNVIALLSSHRQPLDAPSPSWLGHHASAPQISASGLWNVDHVDRNYDSGALDLLEEAVNRTVKHSV